MSSKATRFLTGLSLVVIPTVLGAFLYSRIRSVAKAGDGASASDTALLIKVPVTILYGTTTGNARNFAERMVKRINNNPLLQHAYEAASLDLASYEGEDKLAKQGLVLIICSTWTDGKPPESCTFFFSFLQDFAHDYRVSKDLLKDVQFAIFGLGSAYYKDDYCKHLVAAQEHMTELGAESLCPLRMGDDQTDLEPKFDKWEREMMAVLRHAVPAAPAMQEREAPAERIVNRAGGKVNVASAKVRTPRTDKINTARNLTARGNSFQMQHQEAFGKPVGLGGANKRQKGGDDGASVATARTQQEQDDLEEEEEEDRANNRFVTMDNMADEDKEGPPAGAEAAPADGLKFSKVDANLLPPVDGDSDSDAEPEAEKEEVLDLEDLGPEMGKQVSAAEESKTGGPQAMVTKLQRKALTKEGYRIIGTHSAVKLCRWTKNQMRGRGGCYKHTFYGITSYQCMEATPSLACANKCVFCWRHHKNPVGTEWRWKEDEPEYIVDEAVELHRAMINEMRGVPGVMPERLADAINGPHHCALSLVGEPIMYPRINEMMRALHMRRISTFMVTNAQFPKEIAALDPVTQLYVSVDASNKESLKAIDRPLFKDYWERFTGALLEMSRKRQRTVYRLTLVSGWNMNEIEGYAELVEAGLPDFIEIKAVTYCGKSDASSLTMENVPWHK